MCEEEKSQEKKPDVRGVNTMRRSQLRMKTAGGGGEGGGGGGGARERGNVKDIYPRYPPENKRDVVDSYADPFVTSDSRCDSFRGTEKERNR